MSRATRTTAAPARPRSLRASTAPEVSTRTSTRPASPSSTPVEGRLTTERPSPSCAGAQLGSVAPDPVDGTFLQYGLRWGLRHQEPEGAIQGGRGGAQG